MVPTVSIFAAIMGMPSHVVPLCKNLNFRIKDTSDLELRVERLGLNITSLKPSLISDSICMAIYFSTLQY
jgi:hypothetical protein